MLLPMLFVGLLTCTSASQGTDAKQKLSELQATKIAFLEEAGLLQQGAAERTEFVLTRGKPLTDELLTAVQVRKFCNCGA
jgi:hypothetical protein